MSKHALLSPSSAARWLNCTPSAMLEKELSGEGEAITSKAAEEGTAAHALCEHKLRRALKHRSKRPTSEYDSDEMEECSDAYVEFVLEKLAEAKQVCSDPIVLVEQHVNFSEYVTDGYGTADCVIIADKKLYVIDFKYGVGHLVDAYENPQMKCYALGALAIYDYLYDIEEVSMSIFQPRRDNVSTYEETVDDLKEWANTELKPKADLAIKGEGEFKCGEWCDFCKASIKCRARAEKMLEVTKTEFKKPPLITDEEINSYLPLLPNISKWVNDISAYALDQAVNRRKAWDGFKVVEGRSVRKYKDEERIASIAKENGYTDIYKKSVIPITEMEKLMGKKTFDELLGKEVYKPQGKPTLVPVTDKRQEMNVTNVNDEFKKEND